MAADTPTIAFADTAAASVFEHGLDFASVVEALHAPHFKQPSPLREGHGTGRFTHYVRVAGQPCKAITADADPRYQDGTTLVIGFYPLEKDSHGNGNSWRTR